MSVLAVYPGVILSIFCQDRRTQEAEGQSIDDAIEDSKCHCNDVTQPKISEDRQKLHLHTSLTEKKIITGN